MPDAPPPFALFGPAHLAVLFLTLAIPLLLCLLCRRNPSRIQTVALSLATLLLANKLAVFSYACIQNSPPWLERLPMHLCDWITFIAAAALIFRKQILYELTFFWGLAGTLQATITPDLPYGFPHFYFFTFNISHSGILIAVAFLTFAMAFRPFPASILRAYLCLQGYLIIAVIVNLLTSQNYGYLCRKPVHPTLLDRLGDWPWYILSMEILALIFFLAYYLPFYLLDNLRGCLKNAED